MSLHFDSVWGGGFALSKRFEPGLHCLLGGFDDGAAHVFQLASGARKPEHGKVTLDGVAPFESPATRARIGVVAQAIWLPETSSVLAALGQLQAMHAPEQSSDSPSDCLERLGLEHLGSRATASLSHAERRAVSLSLALGLREPKLLLLAEPFGVPGVRRAAVREALDSAARSGVVLVATQQHKLAIELAAPTSVFAAGRLLEGGSGAGLGTSTFGCFRISCADPKQLATALLPLPEVVSVQAPLHSSTLEVTGVNPAALSLAIAATALECGVAIHNLTEVPAQLDVLQSAVRGRADGTYAAAYQAAWQAQMAAAPAPGHPNPAASGLQIFGAPRPSNHGAYSGRIDDGGRWLAEPPAAGAQPEMTTDPQPAPEPAADPSQNRGNG